MGRTSDNSKRKDTSKQRRPSKKKKVTGAVTAESQVQEEDGVSDVEVENIVNKEMRSDVNKNIAECRKAMEEMLVKIQDLEVKVTILDKRVTEVQLDRSSGTASVEGLGVRKRNSCLNEKDSLFKEAYECATGKIKVYLLNLH